VIHAVEEAIFPALLANLFARKVLIYDMDSSLAEQLTEGWPLLYPMRPLLRSFERLAVRQSDAVIAVCQVLADKAAEHAPDKPICVLNDVALEAEGDGGEVVNLRDNLRLRGRLALYVGNLEHYQGIELMLEAFARLDGTEPVDLVVIGGNTDDIAIYQTRAHQLGITDRTHFIGPRPLPHLSRYLAQADILLSPRLRGVNTPMKIYSYMLAGKAILATNIVSHTQVLDMASAALADPTPAALAEGLMRLLRDSALRERLGIAAAAAVRQRYSHAEFERKLLGVYAELSAAGAVGAAERA
jgi:glycosyltransferase involved in cell wall biosynthesis